MNVLCMCVCVRVGLQSPRIGGVLLPMPLPPASAARPAASRRSEWRRMRERGWSIKCMCLVTEHNYLPPPPRSLIDCLLGAFSNFLAGNWLMILWPLPGNA